MASDKVGELRIVLSLDSKQFDIGLSKVVQSNSKGTEKFKDAWSAATAFADAAVAKAFDKISTTISNSINSAINRADTLNNFPKVMQSLGYSSEESKSSIDLLKNSIDGLPTSLDDIVGNVQTLTATMGNLNKGEVNATKVGIAFNNMMLAGGQGVQAAQNALTQYNQMLAVGKVDQAAWNSVVSAAPGQLNQVAQSLLGVDASQQDLYRAMQDGAISFDDFNKAIVNLNTEGGEGFSSFEEQARSATGGIGTALDNVGNRASKAIEQVINTIGAENIANAINEVSSKFSDLANSVSGVITFFQENEWAAKALEYSLIAVGIAIASIKVANFTKKIVGGLKNALTSAKNISSELSKIFKVEIGQKVSTEAGESVSKVSTSMTEKIVGLGSKIQTALQTLGGVLKSVVETIMEPIKAALKGAGEALAGFFTALANPTIAVGAAMFAVAAGSIAAAILLIGGAIGLTMPTWEALFNSIIMPTAEFIATTVLALLDNLTNNIIRLTNEALIPLGNFIVGSFITVVNQVTDAIIRFTQLAIIPLVGTLSGALMGILDRVASFLNNTLKTAFDGIKGIVDSVGEAFRKMGEVVVSALNSVNGILSTFRDLLLGVADAIVAVVALATGHSVDYGRGFAHISKAATGGRVSGVGTATSDSNLFALSKGEYVIKASSAKRIGYDALDQLNSDGEIAAGYSSANWSGLLAAALAEEFEMGEMSGEGLRPIENTQNIYVSDRLDIRKVGNALLQEVRRV